MDSKWLLSHLRPTENKIQGQAGLTSCALNILSLVIILARELQWKFESNLVLVMKQEDWAGDMQDNSLTTSAAYYTEIDEQDTLYAKTLTEIK